MDTQSSTKFYNCQHSGALLRHFNNFRDNSQFCDVVLISDEMRISAHRSILAASSPYFRAMFNGRFPESAQSEIVLHNMDTDCLKLIIDYVYSGSLQLDAVGHAAQRLLLTASFFQLEWIEECCTHYLICNLEAGNCLSLLQFAEEQSNKLLLDAAQNFAFMHFQQVMKKEEFLELSCNKLLSFFSNDKIFLHSEDALLMGVIKWTEHCPAERRQYLARMLSHLHPACIDATIVGELETLLYTDEECFKWRQNVLDSCASCEWSILILDKMGRKPDLCKFDLSFSTLTALKPLPQEAFAISLAAHRSILYVQGGCKGRCSRQDSFCYNIYRDVWLPMQPLLEPRSHHRALIVDNIIYALGGNGKKGATDSVECLDLETNRAMYVKAMLEQRNSMGAVAVDKCLYVMGGETEHRSIFSAERFDIREGVWYALPPLGLVNSYCTSAAIGDYIYCCQGLGSCMERYDMRAAKWEIIDLCTEREFFEIFSVDNRLYSISGMAISCYAEQTDEWRTVSEYPIIREWDAAVGMYVCNYSM